MIEPRITKEEALSFLLTHIVVEQGRSLELYTMTLFDLMRLAGEAETAVNSEEGVIPHEVIENVARAWIAQRESTG